MPGTLVEQLQLDPSVTYADSFGMATAETTAVTIEDDLNFLRTQMLVVMGVDQTNWFDVPTKTISTLSGQATLEAKLFLCPIEVFTDVTVTAAQNFEILVQATSETPSVNIALNAATKGAVSAQLVGAVGTHALTALAGVNALNPKNLCRVIDSTTRDPILSANKEVFGLLQVELTATDGVAFNDTTNQAQLSFVRINAGGTALEACPVVDIAGKTIRYMYNDRESLNAIDEQCLTTSAIFTDQAGDVSVTLQNSIDNQAGAVAQGAKTIDVQITDTQKWQFSDSVGAGILTVAAAAGGDTVEVGNGANPAGFRSHGTGIFDGTVTIAGDTQIINLGVVTGRIDSTALELAATIGNLSLDSAAELNFSDSRQTTFLPLTSVAAASLTGGPFASLFAAINSARTVGGAVALGKADTNTTGTILSNTVIVGPAGIAPANLAANLLDYTTKTFTTDILIFINGIYQRPGANAATNNDVYPATVAGDIAAGGFFAEKKVKGSANITMILIA